VKLALVNPPWSFERSVYFGCREAHLPLEFGYAAALLWRAGHDARIVDAQLGGFDDARIARELADFAPDATVLTTAPSYLFWRCAPPELRVPIRTARAIREVAGALVVVGPHASTTPRATLRKLNANAAILGECEDVIARLADTPRRRWSELSSVLCVDRGEIVGDPFHKNVTDVRALPALRWPRATLLAHRHHHHRFDRPPTGPGAELEASRGCPYHCSFCAKDEFRNAYRRRPLETVLDELDGLIAAGATYAYFIDEIFVPDADLLDALAERRIDFGVQLRIDTFTRPMLDRLGRAGCVSIEVGIESITAQGRSLLGKHCRLSTEQLTELLVYAKGVVPFVQANLLDASTDPKDEVDAWRARLTAQGVWSNDPIPMFLYPGSPAFAARFGRCDDDAWERAHARYLETFTAFADLQERAPAPLTELEAAPEEDRARP
jgi:anaerobic magnesium-protoporphyrin IX monomethyl ester cyclase